MKVNFSESELYGREQTPNLLDDRLSDISVHNTGCMVVMIVNSQNQVISERTKDLVDKLLSGKFSIAQISRITGISEQWLQNYVNSN